LTYRNVIDQAEYFHTMASLGINGERSSQIYELGKVVLDGYQLVQLERRGKIESDEIAASMAKVGLTPKPIYSLRILPK